MASLLKQSGRVLSAIVLACGLTVSVWAQDKPKVSSGEAELGKKIQSEKGLDKKFEIAKKLLEKYPKSSLRVQFVDYLLNEIANLTDPEQRIAALENSFLSTFTDAAEQNKAVPFLVESYQAAKRWDDAFSYAPKAFEVDPGNVILFTQLAIGGADLARTGKKDYLDQTKDYAGKAIALIEADKKPASLSDGFWADFKKQWLPQLYQSKGILALASGSPTEAKANLQKAITLSPADPYNHFMLGTIVNEDYQKQAKLFNIMPPGAEKDAQLKVIQAHVDEIIDHYAHAVALASLNPQYKNLHDQVLQDLQSYYKFRKGSLDGLQALIDKYKTKPIGS